MKTTTVFAICAFLSATVIHAAPAPVASNLDVVDAPFDAVEVRVVEFDAAEIEAPELAARDIEEEEEFDEDFEDLDDLEALDSRDLVARANLPGLTKTQSARARSIMAEVKKEKLGKQGCLAGIATGLTEASLLIYANKNVPKSLKYKHDAVGSDHDSVGIFQQRVSIYKNIAADMDPTLSARQFFTEMKKVKGWKTMAVGKLCQKVQRSAYPTRYNNNLPLAKKVCKAGGF